MLDRKKKLSCPSKALALYARLEWGLGSTKLLSPFSFSASKGGQVFTFRVHVSHHDDKFNVDLPSFDEDYIILFIPNKLADNCILLLSEDCKDHEGGDVTMQWLAPKIQRKWRMELKEISSI